MLLLDITTTCSNPALGGILAATKKILQIIHIVVPIVLMISLAIGIFQLMMDPERKNGLKSILNKLIAAIIIFFIPMFLNLVMALVGESTDFSDCWNNSHMSSNSTPTYVQTETTQKASKIISNSSDYEKGEKKKETSVSSTHPSSGTVTPVSSSSSNAGKVIFVGDSRTVQMYAYLSGSWSGANYSSGGVHVLGNDVFIAQGSMGLDWLKSTGIPEAKKYFGNGSALVILMGVNDVRHIDSYISYLKSNVSSWTKTGTKVYYSAVTPCDGSRNSFNSKIMSFNSKLSSNLPSGIVWIDTYEYLSTSGYTTTDGLHYNKDTSYKIYNYIKSKV